MKLKEHVLLQIRKYPKLVELLTRVAQKVSPETVVVLEYPVNSTQRWTQERPHKQLFDIINCGREKYKEILTTFLTITNCFGKFPQQQTTDSKSAEPCWINGWMPALDAVALYSFIAINKPELYMEVGSGNSTKFARRAISDHNLSTIVVSIDPHPRAEVDRICDEIVRKPVEDVDPQIFDRLKANDILYIDNSHRAFMNSDVTTLFLGNYSGSPVIGPTTTAA